MNAADASHLQEALRLAEAGCGLASPNPQVGAVVVDSDGRKVGSGIYKFADRKHAEVLALEEAGGSARGGTLYVSLEPCSVHGRTPPCVGAILEAGVSRVVVASRDENPAIDGAGLALLREEGVMVEKSEGEIAEQARRLNEAFFHFKRTGLPLVTLKTALTLDGKIAAPDNNEGWITSAKAREHVHTVRHRHDAIMTGIGTVQSDNPRLTDRSKRPRRRPLLRVVADSLLRLRADSIIVRTFRNDLLVATTSAASKSRREVFQRLGIPLGLFDAAKGRVDLAQLVEYLGRQDITSLMIEGGPKLNWTVLESKLADKILLYYAPKFLGGYDSVPMVGGTGRRSRDGALRVTNLRTFTVAPDEFAVEASLAKDQEDGDLAAAG